MAGKGFMLYAQLLRKAREEVLETACDLSSESLCPRIYVKRAVGDLA